MYCEKPDHRSVDCKTVASVDERKRVERQPSSPSQQRSWKSSTIGEPCEEVTKPRNYCIVERVSGPVTGRQEFYIPHKPVLQESAETTKLRVVYDASARANSGAPSLNECLNPGPPLQNQLWNVLVCAHFHPVAIAGDIKQAFLQVRIREEDCDALRFHWLKDLNSQTVQALRFSLASPAHHFFSGELYNISWRAAERGTQRLFVRLREAFM